MSLASSGTDDWALQQAPGWYGKLGALGDFASRRLPSEHVASCDHWLTRAMHDSRATLGERWLQAYLSAPIWRYAWAPGVVDSQWWFGVLMPSCDAVGRYFPLLIAQARVQAPQDRLALDHLELWWRHLIQAALATLNEGASVDAFESDLAAAPPWPTASRAGRRLAASLVPTIGNGSVSLHPLAPHEDLSSWVQRLAADELGRRLSGRSLWWPMAAPQSGQHPAIRLGLGLPDGTGFAQMLSSSA
jgi:type VI secretion system protein ImpM